MKSTALNTNVVTLPIQRGQAMFTSLVEAPTVASQIISFLETFDHAHLAGEAVHDGKAGQADQLGGNTNQHLHQQLQEIGRASCRERVLLMV